MVDADGQYTMDPQSSSISWGGYWGPFHQGWPGVGHLEVHQEDPGAWIFERVFCFVLFWLCV